MASCCGVIKSCLVMQGEASCFLLLLPSTRNDSMKTLDYPHMKTYESFGLAHKRCCVYFDLTRDYCGSIVVVFEVNVCELYNIRNLVGWLLWLLAYRFIAQTRFSYLFYCTKT